MNQSFDNFPLQSATDVAILMYREVHFGGNFKVMLQYYEKGGKGICSEFEIDQIRKLAELELQSEQNIAPMILTGMDAERVAQAKKTYEEFRDLFDDDSPNNRYPQLIANLVLAEESFPKEEIQAIVQEKEAIVPSLLELLRSEKFYDPLFPGYGQAPKLAAKCLGMIGDKRSIVSLFESIGERDFFHEDTLLNALKAIGNPAKEFLLQVVKGHPIDSDNEKAAIALIAFREDSDVAEACFQLLQELEMNSHTPLHNYLVLACEGLKDPHSQQILVQLMNNPAIPRDLSLDIHNVAKKWV